MKRAQMVKLSGRVINRVHRAIEDYDNVTTRYPDLSEGEALERAQVLMQNRCMVVITRAWDNSFVVVGVLDV